jgi:integrase
MASVYVKGQKIYISWYDPIRGKRYNRSTKLLNNKQNMVTAGKMAKDLQSKLDEQSEELKSLQIKRLSLRNAFNHFLKNNSHKNEKTIRDYYRFYNKFTETFSEDIPCSAVNKLDVEAWLNVIKTLPYAKNTIFGYYKQLNHFLNFLFEYSYTPMFKINKDVKPKREIKEKIVFKKSEIDKIFECLDDESLDKNSHFKTLIYLIFFTGLRSSDLLTITGDKIDFESRELKYYSPKRKIYRSIAFHKKLIPILQERVNEVGDGKILNYNSVENLGKAITRYLNQIGLGGKGYTARTFRKTFITFARGYGMDSSIVAELVGHAHQSTADRFYNRIDLKLMRKELKKFKYKVSMNL